MHLLRYFGRFQSTHPHGVRQARPALRPLTSYFNPRTRMGCDIGSSEVGTVLGVFQSTHPHGVRHRLVENSADVTQFQSTHPHGVRLSRSRGAGGLTSYFNPRTRMGCDGHESQGHQPDGKFQSTHPHGVRRGFDPDRIAEVKRFQSTHPHGVRRRQGIHTGRYREFQSTHPHGVRRI